MMATFRLVPFLAGFVWGLAGVLAYGVAFDDVQRVYPGRAWHNRHSMIAFSTVIALWGPVGLVLGLLMARRFTPRWRSISQDASWRWYQQEFPYLAMDGFEVWLRWDERTD